MIRLFLLVVTIALVTSCAGDDTDKTNDDVAREASTASLMSTVTATAVPASTATAIPTVVQSPSPSSSLAVVASPSVAASPATEIAIRVAPSTGTYGDEFDYSVSALEPHARYVVVTREPGGIEWWEDGQAGPTGDTLLVQDPNHAILQPLRGWVSAPGEPPGEYTVELRAADRRTVLATTTFTVHE